MTLHIRVFSAGVEILFIEKHSIVSAFLRYFYESALKSTDYQVFSTDERKMWPVLPEQLCANPTRKYEDNLPGFLQRSKRNSENARALVFRVGANND